jgi:hypothetical protein
VLTGLSGGHPILAVEIYRRFGRASMRLLGCNGTCEMGVVVGALGLRSRLAGAVRPIFCLLFVWHFP